MVCSDWLVSNNLCTARILACAFRAYVVLIYSMVRMLRCNLDGHIELGDGPLNSVDGPQVVFACPLNPHFAHSATHCVG